LRRARQLRALETENRSSAGEDARGPLNCGFRVEFLAIHSKAAAKGEKREVAASQSVSEKKLA
jgi:hypothetical protein